MITTSLETTISSAVAYFVTGRRPLAEYDEFLAECMKMGAEKLADLYRENAGVVDPSVLGL